MPSGFRPDRKGVVGLSKQPEQLVALRGHAERVKKAAERLSPRGTSRVGYARRFRIRPMKTSVRVGNTDVAAHLVEFGSVNNPPYAPLRRGVLAAGLRLDESPPPEPGESA